jgi:hypothetical protein
VIASKLKSAVESELWKVTTNTIGVMMNNRV